MKKKWFMKICYIGIWLLLWEILSLAVHNRFLISGPVETLAALGRMMGEADFYRSIAGSLLRILGGFFAGALLGTACAAAGYKSRIFAEFMSPFVTVMKSVPVASFVILLLIWSGAKNTPFFIVALVSFPILYLNTLSGLKNTDSKMLEMAQIYRITGFRKLKAIYLPELRPYLESAISLAIGMGFKSGVAAEVIGQPLHTIGNNLYRAKVMLETDRLFAWTVAIILLSYGTEWLIRRLFLGKMRDENRSISLKKDRK